VEGIQAATRQAILGDGLQTIVAKVEPVGPKAFVTDLGLLETVSSSAATSNRLAAKSH